MMCIEGDDDLDQDPYTFARRDFNNGGCATSFDSEFLEYSRAIVPAATVDSTSMSQGVKEIDSEAARRGEKAIGLIKLKESPEFSTEDDPVPKKNTRWDLCPDFTDKQASSEHNTHILQFKNGVLEKYFHKLLKIDPRNNRDLVSQDSEALGCTANVLLLDESQRLTLSPPGGMNPVHVDSLLHNQSAALRSDFFHLIDTLDSLLDVAQPYPMDDYHFDDQAVSIISSLPRWEMPNRSP